MLQPVHIQLPYLWDPREDQLPLWLYLERGGTRADVTAHRRWGKDDVSLHWSARAMHKRVGVYWHMLPEAAQARKAIWDAINPRTGKRRIDEAFPHGLRDSTREQDMFIKFKCGSTWQVIGSDNYNSLVGSPPIGVIFSEWALADPKAWMYIRPILLENGGWAVFIWTPRGRNHATRAFEARAKDPTWFTQRMPAAKAILDEQGNIMAFMPLTPVFTSAQLMQELQEMIAEEGSEEEGTAKFNQEYLVDFDAPSPGSYYGKQIQDLITAGRLCSVPFDPRFKVSTAWDLGIDDYTDIWFFQRITSRRVNVIDHYECADIGFDTIVPEALDGKDYKYDMHYLPHDVMARELGSGGRARKQTLHLLGVRPIRTGVQRDPAERVNATRRLLPYCWFDEDKCTEGVDHLKQYKKRFIQALGVYGGPLKDGHDHAADAFGEFAVNAHLPKNDKPAEKPRKPTDRYSKTRGRPANSWKTA